MELGKVIEQLKTRLSGSLPGKDAHQLMAPLNRSLAIPKNAVLIDSAVLLLLYNRNGVAHIVLMKRPEYEGAHSGQISFPGGKYEVFDHDLSTTALRETNEELGIPIQDVTLLGELSRLMIPSGFLVQPFVGYLSREPVFVPDRSEVERVIEVPLSHFLKKNIRGEYNFSSFNGAVLAPYFDVYGQKLWGATSMILSELLSLISE